MSNNTHGKLWAQITYPFPNCNEATVLYVPLLKLLIWYEDDRLVPTLALFILTHWVRVTHINVSKLTIIGSNTYLLSGRRKAIILSNTGILLIESLGTNFSDILIAIQAYSFEQNALGNVIDEMAFILSRTQCVLIITDFNGGWLS